MTPRTLLSSLTFAAFGLAPIANAGTASIEDLTAPQAVVALAENVCLAAAKANKPITEFLPKAARAASTNDLVGRLHTRPYEGQMWAVDTVEGAVIFGSISDTPRGCQILAVTPFSDALTASFQNTLQPGTSSFQLTSAPGSGQPNNGVTWNRYKSDDGFFLDTLLYSFKGADKEGTLHVIVKP